MARPPLERHTLRCTQEEWDAAMAEADRRGEYFSEALRRFVQAYGRGNTGPAPVTAVTPPDVAERGAPPHRRV